VINLSEESEPDIFRAIKRSHFRKCCFKKGTNEVDFEDVSITPNTRVSYPIYHIDNIQPSSIGKILKTYFSLLQIHLEYYPISKLTPGQAAYHFISGYTAKLQELKLGYGTTT
jgi:phosphoenolpyruvate carboxykinase (ATP)